MRESDIIGDFDKGMFIGKPFSNEKTGDPAVGICVSAVVADGWVVVEIEVDDDKAHELFPRRDVSVSFSVREDVDA